MLKSYFIDGDKGGGGKSLFTRAFVHYYLSLPADKRPKLLVIDADTTNPDVCGKGGLTKGGSVEIADLFDLSDSDKWADFGDDLQKGGYLNTQDEVRLIVNLPAGVGPRAFDSSKAVTSELMRAINAVPVWLINCDKDGITALEYRHRAWPARYAVGAVVRNEFFGTPDQFWQWQESTLRKSIVRDDGSAWIEARLPKLNRDMTIAIGRRPFHEVYAHGLTGAEPLGFGSRLVLDAFFRATKKDFARIDALIPSTFGSNDNDEGEEE